MSIVRSVVCLPTDSFKAYYSGLFVTEELIACIMERFFGIPKCSHFYDESIMKIFMIRVSVKISMIRVFIILITTNPTQLDS